MKFVKSFIVLATALSCTFVFAQDGSERAMQAAQQIRLAQVIRGQNDSTGESQRLVKGENGTVKKAPEKSEG